MSEEIRIFHALASGPPLGGGYTARVCGQMRAQRRAGMIVESALSPHHALEAFGRWGNAPGETLRAGDLEFRLFDARAFPRSIRWRARLIGAPGLTGFDWHSRETAKVHEAYARRLAERLDPPPQVVIVHSPAVRTHFGFELARLLSCPVVYDIHGMVEESNAAARGEVFRQTRRYQRIREAETQAAFVADRCFVLCETLREEFARRGVPREKMTTIPNGVEAADFADVPGRDAALAQALGLEGAAVVGCATSITPYEALETIVEAVGILRGRGMNATALLVGGGPARGRFERSAREAIAAGHVAIVEQVPPEEVRRYLGLMDLFVVSRRWSRVCELVAPLKPFEAMAAGAPLIVSDQAALRETIQDGLYGWRFAPENGAALAEVCAHLLGEGREKGREKAAKAREWVMRERNWDVLARMQKAVLEETIRTRAAVGGPVLECGGRGHPVAGGDDLGSLRPGRDTA